MAESKTTTLTPADLPTMTTPGWVRWYGTLSELTEAGLIPAHIDASTGRSKLTEWAVKGVNCLMWRYRRPGVQLPTDVIRSRDYWLLHASNADQRGAGIDDGPDLEPAVIAAVLTAAPRALRVITNRP